MARTATLPGVKDERNPELIELALEYVEHRDARMAMLKNEVSVKEQLIEKMRELKLTSYHDDERDLTITLETQTKVKVKVKLASEEDDDE